MVRTGKVETILQRLDATHNPVLKTLVIFDDDGSQGTVYVKRLLPEVVANEVLGSLIGRSLGIQIPDPCVVELDGRLIGSNSRASEKCFGSIAIEDSGFEQFLIDDAAFVRFIADYERSFDVAVFDEWILNDDRNAGNLIIDGKDIWFFDHDRCLPIDAEADRLSRRNILFDIIQKAYSNDRVERSRSYYREKLYGSIMVSALREYLDICEAEGLISKEEHLRRTELLSNRVTYLSSFIDSRFCVDQRDLFGQGLL